MSMQFREQAASPVHASPAGAHTSAAFVASLFAAAVFLFTAAALAGPPNIARSFILVGYLLAGAALCRGLFRLTDRKGWGRRPWLQCLGIAAACAATIGIVLFAVQSLLNGEIRWETLPWILALGFGLTFSGCALSVSRRLPPAPASAPVAKEAARFMERLPRSLRSAELLAVQAEDHYLRVYTTLGEALILMRLSDALVELAGAGGLQTHRSWWIARAAVADVVREGRQATLVLKSGCRAPVSRARLKELHSLNWF